MSQFDVTRDEFHEPYTRITEWLPLVKPGLHGNVALDDDLTKQRRVLEKAGIRYLIKRAQRRKALFAHNVDFRNATGVTISDKSLWQEE